ncbi:putative collagen-binding domain-containing protein [Paenibacillus arenilitoris]
MDTELAVEIIDSTKKRKESMKFVPPTSGRGEDWVLVLN